MATYIDLNPVRAEMIEDPKNYRHCGYGAAMGGDGRCRRGIMEITGIDIEEPYPLHRFNNSGDFSDFCLVPSFTNVGDTFNKLLVHRQRGLRLSVDYKAKVEIYPEV